jgi:tryptophan halogenase
VTALSACVLGGGTAGFMAAAHLTRWFPSVALTHVFDSRIPTIGVGEGTTPPFLAWLRETTGLTLDTLVRRAHATPKHGIRFENWGRAHPAWRHWFAEREGIACHLSAARVVDLLAEHVEARRLDARVEAVRSDGRRAVVVLEGGARESFDLVVDARGFPRPDEPGTVSLDVVPTNAALLRPGPPSPPEARVETRAIARPHGWVFAIPLSNQTSWGYVHHAEDAAEAEADFAALLAAEGVPPGDPPRRLAFPNFRRETMFDGAHLRIGNAASFLEPLEATAIMIVTWQLRLLSGWMFLRLTRGAAGPDAAAELDRHATGLVDETARFVGWHYASGAPWDTPFWRRAAARWAAAEAEAGAPDATAGRFRRFEAAGARLPPRLAFVQDRAELSALERGADDGDTFGGFLVESFAKVGHGLGRWAAAA